MTDREMLELAAKAAGYTVNARMQAERDALGFGDAGLWIDSVSTCWSPRDDDGAALRLAVKLRMMVSVFGADVRVDHGGKFFHEDGRPSIYAATRRAIVRAAAEIGRAMR